MKKNKYILFVTSASQRDVDAVKRYNEKFNTNFRILVLRDKNKKNWEARAKKRNVAQVLTCDFNKPQDIEKALAPWKQTIHTVTFRGETNASFFAKIVPHLPYIDLPSAESIEWATDKIAMRHLFEAHDKAITPAFTIVKDNEEKTIERIIKKVGFPLIIKPSGLALSLLVTMCYHEDELRSSLKTILRKIKKIYKENNRVVTPKLLVEQFMEGEMYSVDAYVDKQGNTSFCPFVYVKTGKSVGFDDFFGYLQMTPSQLSTTNIQKAEIVAKTAIQALNLHSTTVHIELMRTEDGWKIIELGPRIGGFRHHMYMLSYGIDHDTNDLIVRLNKKPIIPKKRKTYVAVMKLFAKEEGILQHIEGIRKIKKLSSFTSIATHIQPGEKCMHAKHGGKSVCDITLSHVQRPELLADIRRIEQIVKIELQPKQKKR
ncbi:MAG: hypothetical protein COU32_03605 [Candidatus Magasanikbacteria bacterium CG10_big_fil_rev_8_21_14_0_10_42_10]|uniref:ATP-grasp domain-containing protein n=2 Tax=Candidatus Magasanikiibacteriota TaxID=1752731 RepID=A0A2H0TXA3_9BACT|nr:MAG: hypothetical protein COU32_03605 [Candidatus Magasanikbacteria bacterium CG10_big_fil_rev_8_21_14_0_10_42_10]PIZ94398.1 MAG: hypothetical protein COX82_00735 [Candidatus Magasanikbacteria bacterium CG_4_10_14_0_2_um_filter_41_10]